MGKLVNGWSVICTICDCEVDPRGQRNHEKSCAKHPGAEILTHDWARSKSLRQMARWHKVGPRTMRRWLQVAGIEGKTEERVIGGGTWDLVPEIGIEFERNALRGCSRCPAFVACNEAKMPPFAFVFCEIIDSGQVTWLEWHGIDIEAEMDEAREYVRVSENGRVADPAGAKGG